MSIKHRETEYADEVICAPHSIHINRQGKPFLPIIAWQKIPVRLQLLSAWGLGGSKFVLHTGSGPLPSLTSFRRSNHGSQTQHHKFRRENQFRGQGSKEARSKKEMKGEGHSQTHCFLPHFTICSATRGVSAKNYPKSQPT